MRGSLPQRSRAPYPRNPGVPAPQIRVSLSHTPPDTDAQPPFLLTCFSPSPQPQLPTFVLPSFPSLSAHLLPYPATFPSAFPDSPPPLPFPRAALVEAEMESWAQIIIRVPPTQTPRGSLMST